MIDQSPDSERQALEDLLRSDGWAVYVAHIAQAWGPGACEAALREARKIAAPEDWPFESSRILDTFAGMRANLRWPEERVRTLKGAPKKQPVEAAMERFQQFRRAPR